MGKDNGKPYIGIDLGGTNISLGLISGGGKILQRVKIKTKAEQGPDGVLSRIVEAVRNLIARSHLNGPADAAALGIGAPGTVNIKTGVVRNAVNLCWDEYPLGHRLQKILGIPVTVDNDVNVGAWGEHRAGAGKAHDDMLAVFVGTGIGAGLVLGGKLYHGHFQTAGEIGQTILMPGGSLGRRTLESFSSRTAVVNLIRELILSNHHSSIVDAVDGRLDKIRSKVLATAFAEGDYVATHVIEHSAYYVGISIANTVTMLSLPCVVLGGGLVEALGRHYLELVQESFEEHVHPAELHDCKLVVSKLGDDAGIVGAAILARDRLAPAASTG